MKFYFVSSAEDAPFSATLAEAKSYARHIAATSYSDIDIELVEIDTTKENILRLANVAGGYMRTIKTVYTAKAKLRKDAR
jgi:hypothetical protein